MNILVIGKFYIEGFGLHIAETLMEMGHTVRRFEPGLRSGGVGGSLGHRIAQVRGVLYANSDGIPAIRARRIRALWTEAEVGSLDVVIVAGDGNPASTLYAIQVDPSVDGFMWVQADGSLGPNPVYQTASEWASVTVTGLEQGMLYSIQVVAQNGAGFDTGAGTAATGSLSPQVPVAGIAGLAAAVFAVGFLGTLRLRRRMK